MATPLRAGFEQLRRVPLLLFVLLYTVVTGGPLLWVATMSLRTTSEIFKDPYGVPSPIHCRSSPMRGPGRTTAPISGTAPSSSYSPSLW